MRGVAAQRIVRTIRKPRNKADEAIAPKPGWDGAFRAICFVARLANSACYWHRLASRISSRKASVATTRGLFRGSLSGMAEGWDFLVRRVLCGCIAASFALSACEPSPAPPSASSNELLVLLRPGPAAWFSGPHGQNGFDYDLAHRFAKEQGFELKVAPIRWPSSPKAATTP